MAEGTSISRLWLAPWLRATVAGGIVVALVVQLGVGPILSALRNISLGAVLAALVVTAGTTWCCARRWSLLAGRLEVGIATGAAFRAYYRAQLLNATLPSVVVGEVDRALWHGHSTQAMSRGILSVVWDRVMGQLVLFGLVLLAIPVLSPPLRGWMMWSLVAVTAVVLAAHASRSTFVELIWTEIRGVPGAPEVGARVVMLSTLAVAGHLVVFVIAARAVGVDVSLPGLVPLGLVVLQVSAIPLGVAGWGPREGGAALVFGAAGLNASTGLAVAVTYGVLATLATLPGVLALRRRAAQPTSNLEGGPSWATAPTQS